ncbi:MAG TPA: thiopeptide-type bacteriocin biosynthesis protein [Thermoanaerobaculia bacterium]|nr:thiopeptide-type bacteriocin biosynthesis protein [Thermoanaerobaculia bacterium]
MAGPQRGAWVGVHLFLDGERGEVASSGDRVLREVVGPLVRELAAAGALARYFFIRYAEGGPHLRLRLQPPGEHGDAIAAALARHAHLEPEQGDEAGPFRPSRHPVLRLVRRVAYRPEIWRYGGERGVEVSEDLFHLCSEVALELVATGEPPPPPVRAAHAVLALTVLLHAFCRDRATAVEQAQAYSREWVASMDPGAAEPLAHQRAWQRAFELNADRQPPALREAVATLWSALDAGDTDGAPQPLARLYHGAVRIRQQLEELTAAGGLADPDGPLGAWQDVRRLLVSSYVHMMSNRLGITTFQEAFTGRMLARFLEPVAVFPPTREGGSHAQEDRAQSG